MKTTHDVNRVTTGLRPGKISRADMLELAQKRAAEMNGFAVSSVAVEDLIDRAEYSVPPGTATTVCTLILKSGFTVTDTAACNVDPSLFDPEIGMQFAYSKAVDQLYQLLAFHYCELMRSKDA